MNRKRKIYILVISILAILIILSFPLIISQIRFHNVLADLKAQGIPTTAKEFFDKHYKPVPEEQNAATALKRIFSLYKESSNELSDKLACMEMACRPGLDQKTPYELIKFAKIQVDNNKNYFTELAKINNYKYVRFKHNDKSLFEKCLVADSLASFRRVYKSWEVKIEISIADGNESDARETVYKLFYFCDLANQNPTTIEQLVFYGCVYSGLNSFQRYLNNFNFKIEDLEKIESLLRKQEAMVTQSWLNIVDMESIFLIHLNNNFIPYIDKYHSLIEFSGNKPSVKKSELYYYYFNGGVTNGVVKELKLLKELAKLSFHNYKNIQDKLETIKKHSEDNFKFDPGTAKTCAVIAEKKTEVVAEIRCAIIACAIERFYLKYKKLPENLDKLVPEFISEVPIDPFNGEQLSYYRGEFELEYEIPSLIEKKETLKEKSAEGETFECGNSVKYTKVIKKKKGYVVHSVGRDLKANITFPLNGNRFHDKDTVFIVVKQ